MSTETEALWEKLESAISNLGCEVCMNDEEDYRDEIREAINSLEIHFVTAERERREMERVARQRQAWNEEHILRVAAMESVLRDIYMQATRMNRASDLKRYLVTDLEIIASKVDGALAAAARDAAAES